MLDFPNALRSDVKVRAAALLTGLVSVNALVWLLTWGAAHHVPSLAAAGLLAYGFGLRHAVDADHISAIDNTTRRLMQQGKRPVGVGFFFSLGHSTVVVLLCVALALSAAYVQTHLPQWKDAGGVVGTVISSRLSVRHRGDQSGRPVGVVSDLSDGNRQGGDDPAALDQTLEGRGLMTRLLRPLLRLIHHSWQMYFVGFLFGLGFDTATEVGILALSAKSGQSGVPLWVILLLPALFTAGMCLVDTLDGILMLGAYGWAFVQPRRKLLYNLGITLLSVLVAFVVGTYELLQVLEGKFSLRGGFWRLLDRLPFDNLGFVIVGTFALGWGLSVLVYRLRQRGPLAPNNGGTRGRAEGSHTRRWATTQGCPNVSVPVGVLAATGGCARRAGGAGAGPRGAGGVGDFGAAGLALEGAQRQVGQRQDHVQVLHHVDVVQAVVFPDPAVHPPLLERALVGDVHAPVQVLVDAVVGADGRQAAPEAVPARQPLHKPQDRQVKRQEGDQSPPVHGDVLRLPAFGQDERLVALV